ncbi:MAG: outer membrane beta-barrel protein [Spirochaetes bacterium]|nr:outer membrane beta-barrel protein [Spirochaetota bacterium]
MKPYITHIFLALCIVAIPSVSFAIADIAVMGGYTPYGKIEFYDKEYDSLKGFNYGLMGHLNVDTEVIMFGLGIYYHGERLQYTFNGDKRKFTVLQSWGPDLIIMITASEIISPYARVGIALFSELKYDYGYDKKEKTRFFNSAWWAIGSGIHITQEILVFGELQRISMSHDNEHSAKRYTLNAGAMFNF